MHFLLNEQSIHRQFNSAGDFHIALSKVMNMKKRLASFELDLKLTRLFYSCEVGNALSLRDAIRKLPKDKRNSVMSWITSTGPFWSDDPYHSIKDTIKIGENNITGTALAEAAFFSYLDEKAAVISFSPSDWEKSPLKIDIADKTVAIENFYDEKTLTNKLPEILCPINSWEELSRYVQIQFDAITFLKNAFDALKKQPFSNHIVKELVHLLGVLQFLKQNYGCGERWDEKHRLYFIAGNPRFSDSSDSEKRDFKKELTFCNPETGSRNLFCPWHGKIHSPQIRIHFTYPIQNDKPLYVAYIGPKLTKR